MGEVVLFPNERAFPEFAKEEIFGSSLPSYGPKKQYTLQEQYDDQFDITEAYLKAEEELHRAMRKLNAINERMIDILEKYT